MSKNVILAFPRSGSHLFRFVFEILTETPTIEFISDPIYKNEFPEKINFNVDETKTPWYKLHIPPDENVNNLILILRNPREAITRQCIFRDPSEPVQFKKSIYRRYIDRYYTIIDYYLNFKGNKKVFYYEDMIDKTSEFIKELYAFTKVNKQDKLEYLLENQEKLFKMCKDCDYKTWRGSVSKSHDHWFTKLDYDTKLEIQRILRYYYKQDKYKTLCTDRYRTP